MGNKAKTEATPVPATEPAKPEAKAEKKSFVRVDIRAGKPYGIIRNRQEQMDKLFNR